MILIKQLILKYQKPIFQQSIITAKKDEQNFKNPNECRKNEKHNSFVKYRCHGLV